MRPEREESARRPAPLLAPGDPLPAGHRVGLVLAFALLALLAVRQVGSLDAGFHLRAGEHLLQGNGWPDADPFTYTVGDRPYIDTSWGYQVLAALAHRLGGPGGLVILSAALVLGSFLVVLRTARLVAVDPTVLVASLVVGGLASEVRFEVRPELASWLLLALVLHVLARRARGLPSPLWALPLLHLAWANTHALFVLGWAALACHLVGEAVARRRVDSRLALWSLASVGVTAINPYGLRGVAFPLVLATRFEERNIFGQSIGEFVSPFALKLSEAFPFYPRVPVWSFRLLAAVAAIALFALVRRRRFAPALLLAAFFPLAATMIRNVPLFVVAGLPGWVEGLSAAGSSRSVRTGRARAIARRLVLAGAIAACVLVGLRVATGAHYVASRRPDRMGLGWNGLVVPERALRFAAEAGIEGAVLNHLNFGGYLMWARRERVFIDGRLEVIGEEFYRRYLQILSSEEALEAAVARYRIRWMILPYLGHPRLVARLAKDPRWRLVWVDHLAAVYVRADAPYAGPGAPDADGAAGPIAGLGGATRPGRLARWIEGLYREREFPAEAFGLGLFHYYAGRLDRAERHFRSALRRSDGAYYEIYNNLAAALYQQRRLAEAAECYRVVLADDPGNRLARERLAAIAAAGPPRKPGA